MRRLVFVLLLVVIKVLKILLDCLLIFFDMDLKCIRGNKVVFERNERSYVLIYLFKGYN